MKFEYQEKIDKYVQDKMSEPEKSDFEQELTNNKELLDQLSYTKDVKKTIISRAEKMAKLRLWESEDNIIVSMQAASSSSSAQGRKMFWYWVSGVAAVFVIGLFIISPSYKGNSEPAKFQKNESVDKPTPSFEHENACDSIKSDSILNNNAGH